MTNKEWKEYLIEELDNLIKKVKKVKSFEELNKLSCDFTGNGNTAYEYIYGNGITRLQVFFDEEEKKYGVIMKWTGNSDYGGDNRYFDYYGEDLEEVIDIIISNLEDYYEYIEEYFKKPHWMRYEEEEEDEYKESKD